jgi:NSS family neurotransmitter:Na+ symporter
MNETGTVLALAFFGLMSIAALTSSISMLEVPVSFLVERFQWGRPASRHHSDRDYYGNECRYRHELRYIVRAGHYGQHALLAATSRLGALRICRDGCGDGMSYLKELAKNEEATSSTFFMRWWPWYVRFVCPAIIVTIIARTMA